MDAALGLGQPVRHGSAFGVDRRAGGLVGSEGGPGRAMGLVVQHGRLNLQRHVHIASFVGAAT